MSFQDEFIQRWNDIVAETISTVRRQLSSGLADSREITMTLQEACKEWTNGNLGPSVWFNKLKVESPAVAEKFEKYVNSIQVKYIQVSRPSNLGGLIATPSVTAITFWLLGGADKSSSHSLPFTIVVSIATGILTWTIAQSIFKNKNRAVEDSVVEEYKKQLEKHRSELLKIIS